MGTLFKVGEIAKESGKTVRAIHLYEEMGLISCAERSDSGYRLFDVDTLKRLSWISDLQELGMSLTDIRRLVARIEECDSGSEVMCRIRGFYQEKLGDVRDAIASLRRLEGELVCSIDHLDVCPRCRLSTGSKEVCLECTRERGGSDYDLIGGLLANRSHGAARLAGEALRREAKKARDPSAGMAGE